MIGFGIFIYLIIGFIIVFNMSVSHASKDEESPFLIMYVFGTIFWPMIFVMKFLSKFKIIG